MLNLRTLRTRIFNILELLGVIFVGFGFFIYSSTKTFIENNGTPTNSELSTASFYFIIFIEVIALAIILYILRKRNWKLKEFNLGFQFNMILVTLILIGLRYGLTFLFQSLLSSLDFMNFSPEVDLVFNASFCSIVLILIVNSFFEEFLLIGYLFKRLDGFNIGLIIFFSILIRVSYHTYQGIEQIPGVIALGLVFGIYYSKYRKLWPLIVAHGFGNLFVLLNNEYQWISL